MTYDVDHKDWCHAVRHQFCCSANGEPFNPGVDPDDCDCGAVGVQDAIACLDAIKQAIDDTGDQFTSLHEANGFLAQIHEAVYGDIT